MFEPQSFYKIIQENVAKYNPQSNMDFIIKAGDFAIRAHGEQTRVSGEPFVEHPFNVAIILTNLEMDDEAIVAGLLHDTVEDTDCTIDDIRENFGENVALLVEGVTKLGKIPYSTKQEQQVENLRKMFLAMAKDIRVIIIKLADRLHNLRTLKSMSPEKQLEKAHETMEVFAPLANRLGMQKMKWELEDLSLYYLDPIAYKEISDHISLTRDERLDYLDNVQQTIQKGLDNMNIKAKMSGRAKHFYSIYKKMYTNNISIDEIYDLLAVRVIVDDIKDCYAVLGMVHEIYKPIPGRFKDYIAMPKKNMYQSLHTSLIGPGGRPFEVQIRTWEMHKIAEVGIAAHWKYKEGVSGATDIDNKLEWVRQLLEIHKDMNDAEEFIHNLKIDLFEDEVFVFSPKGDVINLPSGSCPIDFAYAIHSAIGNKTVGAKVNGKIVTLDHNLVNGDIVEIITSSNPKGPSRDWIKIVKTSQAKKKINDWFKKENREENVNKGKEMIEKELRHLGIPVSVLYDSDFMAPILKKISVFVVEDMFSGIGYGGISINKVLTRIKDIYHQQNKFEDNVVLSDLVNVSSERRPRSNSGIVVKGIDNCLVKIAHCCNPVPGDDIVGYITKGRGVSVHRTDCVNIQNFDNEAENRFIEVDWAFDEKLNYTMDIRIISNDRLGLVVDIMNAISSARSTVTAINTRLTKDALAIIDMTVLISSQEQVQKLIKVLSNVAGVTSVARVKH